MPLKNTSPSAALGTPILTAASQLRGFVEFLECEGADFVTMQFALRWARQSTHAQPATWADRLGVVRRFAEWRSLTDPRTEIPSRRLLPHRRRRKPPYIYSDEEIERIVAQAARLPSASGLRGPTFATLFGLLAASGLRLGEALALELTDVDRSGALLPLLQRRYRQPRLRNADRPFWICATPMTDWIFAPFRSSLDIRVSSLIFAILKDNVLSLFQGASC